MGSDPWGTIRESLPGLGSREKQQPRAPNIMRNEGYARQAHGGPPSERRKHAGPMCNKGNGCSG